MATHSIDRENQPNPKASIDLYWLPLGAGGHFVRLNGHIYEAIIARREHRLPLALYHSALEIRLRGERTSIETAWPIPDDNASLRGVVVEGPVFSHAAGRFRAFRYEVRCWRDGIIPDLRWAVGGPQRVSSDEAKARRVLELVASVPALVWGRDEMGAGDMWNSNSIVAWLLERAGLEAASIRIPDGGRAPGWTAGIVIAASPLHGKGPGSRRSEGSLLPVQ